LMKRATISAFQANSETLPALHIPVKAGKVKQQRRSDVWNRTS
jgi:hypothetical protein